MRRILPSLKIHTWGGLGSQLFAVALALEIKRKFPRRRILITLHTGGVTERLPEVTSLFSDFAFESINDFRNVNLEKRSPLLSQESKTAYLRRFLKWFFTVTGVISTCNNDEELAQLKPWALSCRGHYSYRTIDPNFLSELDFRLSANVKKLDLQDSCAIHYRLGDLLTLSDKNPIPFDCILSEYRKLEETWDFKNLFVFSDSPEKAKDLFEGLTALEISTPGASTIEVMANSVESKFFIGTSSKISFWISGIRAQVKHKPSLLPFRNLMQYRGVVGEETLSVLTYKTND